MKPWNVRARGGSRRAFTLAELIIAGMAGMLVVSAVTISLFQSARARSATKSRLVAYSRASAAMDQLRREISSTIRRSDLFETRILLYDEMTPTPAGNFERDELLVYNISLRPTRPNEYSGEGQEYESHFRVGDDDTGVSLWQRRDPVLDEWGDGGGIASPVAAGIVGLKIEAYDGQSWYEEWDSDIDGIPWAIRLTLIASGQEIGADPYSNDELFATMRTVIPLDRVMPPPPPPPLDEDGNPIEESGEEAEQDTPGLGTPGGGRPGGGAGGGRPGGGAGGGRPGGGRPGGGRPGGGRPGGGGRPVGGGGGGRPIGGPGFGEQ